VILRRIAFIWIPSIAVMIITVLFAVNIWRYFWVPGVDMMIDEGCRVSRIRSDGKPAYTAFGHRLAIEPGTHRIEIWSGTEKVDATVHITEKECYLRIRCNPLEVWVMH